MHYFKKIFCFIQLSLIIASASAQGNKLLKGHPPNDSIPAKTAVKQEIKSRVTGMARHAGISTESISGKTIVENSKRELSSLLKEAGNPAKELLSKIKIFDKGSFFTNNEVAVEAEYSYIRDTSGIGLGVFSDLNGVFNYNAGIGTSIAHMPFDMGIRGNNGIYSFNHTRPDQFYKFNFNHKEYLEELQSKVAAKINPEIILGSVLKRINNIRNNYEKILKDEIGEIVNDFSKKYQSDIQLPENITDLSVTDIGSLKGRLLSSDIYNKYSQNMSRLEEMVTTKKPEDLKNDSVYQQLAGEVKKIESIEKIYKRIIGWKEKFDNNKTVKELRSHLPFTKDNYKSFLSKPQNLTKILDNHVDLTTLQRLFVNITKLDIGQNPISTGDFSFKDIINTGLNTEFKNNKMSAGLLYGKNNTVNNWLQSGLIAPLSNEYSNVMGISLGTGTSGKFRQSVALNSFDFKNYHQQDDRDVQLQSNYLPVAQRRDAAITFHSDYQFGEKHKLSMDVSKSFGSFKNNMSADSVEYKSNALDKLASNEGKSNFAGMIDYDGELFNTDLKLFVKKVGLGYNNPGNAYLRRGETQFGISLSRKFMQKLTIRYNSDFRNQHFDPAKKYHTSSFNNKFQLALRLKKNTRAALTYQRSDYNSTVFSGSSSKGNSFRLQADGGYSFRVLRKKVLNNVTLSQQQFNVPMLSGEHYRSKAILFMHTSTTVLNKNLLTVSVVGNSSNNKDYYFNTSMLNIESDYTYTLLDNIKAGSGIGYYSNTGWNKQIGIKQQMSATLIRNLNIDFEISYRKAVQIIRPELANQLFISSMVHYNF